MAHGYEDLFLCNEVGSLLTPEEGLQRTTLAKALKMQPMDVGNRVAGP